MCNIVFKPAGVELGPQVLEDLELDNPHGYGAMWADKHGLVTVKDVKSLESVYDVIPDDVNAYIHCRLATHGKVNETNCHPFVIKIRNKKYGVMHNGIFNRLKIRNKNLSDTWHFVHYRLAHWLYEFGIGTKKFNDLVFKDLAGDKLAVMQEDGQNWIFNYEKGELTKDGVWYSAGEPIGITRAMTYFRNHDYSSDGSTWGRYAESEWDPQSQYDWEAYSVEKVLGQKKEPSWCWCNTCGHFGDHYTFEHDELEVEVEGYERTETIGNSSRVDV